MKFSFRQFDIDDSGCGMKICSDSVLLGAWFAPAHSHAKEIADVGAGSGLLALLCAQCCPEAHIKAIEIDESAAAACRINAAASPWSDRIETVCDSFDTVDGEFDLIISNPPYFSNGALSCDPQRAQARHEASLGYGTLVRWAAERLIPQGHLGIVGPAEIENDLIFNAELAGLTVDRLLRVCTSARKKATRILCDLTKGPGANNMSELHIRLADGTISEPYRSLVEPFYTKIG